MEQSKKRAMTELKRGRPKKPKQPALNRKRAGTEPHSEVQDMLADLLGGGQSAD